MARYNFALLGLALALCAHAGEVDEETALMASPNPVAGVVKLLSRLEAKIQEEGKDEAAAYDKFACFCKEQADSKLFSINKAGKRIDELAASIKKLQAGIEEFTSDMEEAKERKKKLEGENEKATADRKEQHSEFLDAKADLVEAIDEILDAQEAVKKSAEKQAGFVQLSDRTMALIAKADPGEAKDYAFKGGKTLKKLHELHKDFKARLKKLVEEEGENKHTHDMAEGARVNEIMAKSSLITKCQNVIGQKSEEKSDNEKEKADQEKNKQDDEEFLQKVTDECEEKAGKWDARSKRRSNELTAISECLGFLKGDATSKYSSGAQMAMAQKKTVLSFLQVKSEPKRAPEKKEKVMAVLARQASLLKSSTLEALVMALRENPFNSVKKMIEDLIDKIDKEQEDEDAEIEDCKNDIKDNTKKRAKNAARMEEEEATVVEKTAKISEHDEDAETLGKEISELYKALNEATELRAKESKENAIVLRDAKAGQKSMEQAIKVLKEFYDSDFEKGLFLQKKAREPEIEELDAGGFLGDDADADPSKQGEAKGILGLLGTIKDDYDQTIKNTEKDEKDGESEFNSYKSGTETDIENKEKAKKRSENKSRRAASDVEQAKEDLIQWTKQKKEAEYELSILTPRCLGLGASAEERKKRREEEKKALKDAISILEAMGPAEAPEFLQIRK